MKLHNETVDSIIQLIDSQLKPTPLCTSVDIHVQIGILNYFNYFTQRIYNDDIQVYSTSHSKVDVKTIGWFIKDFIDFKCTQVDYYVVDTEYDESFIKAVIDRYESIIKHLVNFQFKHSIKTAQ